MSDDRPDSVPIHCDLRHESESSTMSNPTPEPSWGLRPADRDLPGGTSREDTRAPGFGGSTRACGEVGLEDRGL